MPISEIDSFLAGHHSITPELGTQRRPTPGATQSHALTCRSERQQGRKGKGERTLRPPAHSASCCPTR